MGTDLSRKGGGRREKRGEGRLVFLHLSKTQKNGEDMSLGLRPGRRAAKETSHCARSKAHGDS